MPDGRKHDWRKVPMITVRAGLVQGADGEWLLVGAFVAKDGSVGYTEAIPVPDPDVASPSSMYGKGAPRV